MVYLGSGGGGASGGGALILNVTNTVIVNGTLSSGGVASGGSGGSINITANTLSGSGTIQAKGGGGGSPGGGGRISLVNVTTFSFGGRILTGSISSDYNYNGLPGTISFPANCDLVVGGAGNPSEIIMGTDSTPYNYSFNSITINNGGVLRLGGNPLLNVVNGATQGIAATISASNITISSGGTLTASSLGFFSGLGPGSGSYTIGATYGGRGGNNTKSTYGSVTNPTSLGSGSWKGGYGSGALILNVTNTLTVNGTLSANGGGSWDGGGSGGSINITAGTLAGSGTIQANGGSTDPGYYGGGGRIKIRYTTKGATNPINSNKVYAYSGGSAGSAGTIYLKSSSQTNGELLVDDNNYGTQDIPIPTNNFAGVPATLTFDSVTVTNSARLVLPTNMTLAVNGDFKNARGSFTAYTNSSVVLTSTNKAIVSGSTTFYNLMSTTQGKVIEFQANSTNMVAGMLTLRNVTVGSIQTGTWWYLTLPVGAMQDVKNVTVRDSNATGGQQIVAYPMSQNLGNNINWRFVPAGTVMAIH